MACVSDQPNKGFQDIQFELDS